MVKDKGYATLNASAFSIDRCTNTNNKETFAISDYSAVNGVTNSTFSDNVFDGGAFGGSGFSMLVENTIFNHNTHIGKGLATDDGYELTGNKVTVTNNIITNGSFGLTGGYGYGKAYNDGWIISNNQVIYTSNTIVAQQPIIYLGGPQNAPIKNMIISNNILDASQAVTFVPGIIVGAYGQLFDAQDINISNNTIKTLAHSNAACIELRGLDTVFNISVSKNNFYGTMAFRVSYPALVGNISITDNDFSKLTPTLGGIDSTFYIGAGGTQPMDSRYKVTGNTYKTNLKALSLSKNTFITTGTGTPETVITGNPGSSYVDETTGNTYKKVTGIGNTGWALQVNGAVTKVALPLSVRVSDSTLIADTVSTTKTGVLMSGYRTNSGDTLATKADVRAGGGGTVTNVSAITLGTTGIDLTSTVATPNTTPVITLNVPNASAANRGALLAADWNTFNSKQNPITFPYTSKKYHTGYNTFGVLSLDSISQGNTNRFLLFDGISTYTVPINNNLQISSNSQTTGTSMGMYFLNTGGVGGGNSSGAAIVGKVGTFGGAWYSGTGLAFKTNPGGDVTVVSAVEQVFINPNGNVGIGSSVPVPTAALQIKAGTATAGTAPQKFTSGVNLTTPEAGAVEYDGTDLYFTPSNAARYKIQKTITTGTAINVGKATLVAGTVTVSTTAALTGSNILVSVSTPGGTQGFLSVPTITNATSFVITSTSATETSVVNYRIF